MSQKKPGKLAQIVNSVLGLNIVKLDPAIIIDYGGTTSGQYVTVDRAMKLSAVFACVRLISETVSTLPLKLYRRNADGSRSVATDHPLYNVLCRSPNYEMTPSRFYLMIVASGCLWGNAYVEKIMIGMRLVSLNPLLPQNMAVTRDKITGGLIYTYTENGVRRVIPEANMMHIRSFGTDGVMGLSTIVKGKDIFGTALAAEETAGKFFEKGLQTSGFITTKDQLNDDQREGLRTSLQTFAGSKNSGKTMVLENDMKYQGMTMNPEAAQMIETRVFEVEEICRMWRVPPFMIGHLDKQSSWASSVEGMNQQFLSHTLRPILVNLEQEIARSLIPALESETIFAEFNVEGLLRADSKGRVEYYNAAVNNGWMSRNEVRQKENLAPVAGGDIYTVQAALIPLDQVGKNLIKESTSE